MERAVDRDESTIDRIETELTKRCIELDPAQQDALMEHLGYIERNKDHMRYPALVAAGLPIGSGITESAAKYVIGRRAKNNGQRWSERGLRGALTLREIHKSDRLPGFWRYLSRGYTAVVKEAAWSVRGPRPIHPSASKPGRCPARRARRSCLRRERSSQCWRTSTRGAAGRLHSS